MDNTAYMTYLLEFIAWRAAPGNMEFEEWQQWFRSVMLPQAPSGFKVVVTRAKETQDASSINETATHDGDGRTSARETLQAQSRGNDDEQKPDARLRRNLRERLAKAKEKIFPEKQDDR